MKSIQLKRNITIIFSTFFAVIVVYLIYTQVYTKNREDHLIQTRFRVLDQVGENLKAKVESYQTNAINLDAAIAEDLEKNDQLQAEFDTLSKSYQEKKIRSDSTKLVKKEDQLRLQQETINNFKKVYNQDLTFSKLRKNKYAADSVIFSIDSVIFKTKELEFKVSNDLLLKNIDRRDVFEKSIIIADTSIIYSSFSNELKLAFIDAKEKGKNQNGLSLTPVKKSDTLFLPVAGKLRAATLHSNRCYNIFLSDGEYKLFLKPVRINQTELFICGLVNYKDFQREKQSIAPWFIIVLSLVLLMICLSLPFVKLKLMAKTEMLGTGTVLYAGLAFLLGASFIVHFLFFQANNLSRREECDNKLKGLSQEIKNSLAAELQLIDQQLSDVDRMYQAESMDKSDMNEPNILGPGSKWYIDRYPYFDYVIWLDKSGMAIGEITPFSAKENLIDYSYRDYFKKKDEWYWPYSGKDSGKKFRIESIVSVTSGDYKAAFSRPTNSGRAKVIVMTGRFSSLIDPIIPRGYKFCIIDKSGKVWFHSNKYQNMSENFILECNDDKLLKAALYADVSRSMNVGYYNNPHRIYIEPLGDLPLYLVSMYDLRKDYSYEAQVFITTLLLICGLFIYMLLLVLLLLLLKRIYKFDTIPGSFQIEFINFRKSKESEYKILIFYFFLALLVFCFIIFRMPDVLAIISIFIIVTVLFTLLFTRLQDFKKGSPAIYIFKGIIALILITLLILFFRETGGVSDKYEWIMFGMMIIIIALSNIDISKFFKKEGKKPEIAYSLVILSMVTLFGVAPILKFFDISARLENNINIRYGQLELANDREARNMEFDKYYKKIENPSDPFKNVKCNRVHNDRKDKGIYQNFWYGTRFSGIDQAVLPGGTTGSEKIETFVNAFRPVYNDNFSVVSKFLLTDSIQNRSFHWKLSGDSSLTLFYNSPTEDIQKQFLQTRVITSTLPLTNIFYPFLKNDRFNIILGILLFIMLIAIIFLFYKLILFTARNVFGISLISDIAPPVFNEAVTKQIEKGNSVMLINPSAFIGFQELSKNISKEFQTANYNWKYPKLNDESTTLLVTNLFDDYRDPKNLADKLTTLSETMQSSGKLIILVTMNPDVVHSFYKDKSEVSKKTDPKAEKKPDDDSESFKKTHHLFQSFLKRLFITYVPVKYPLKEDYFAESKIDIIEKNNDESARQQIARELNASAFLKDLEVPMNDFLAVLHKEKADINERKHLILTRISELAEKYYQSLLETCTAEEKFVLLDLAFDAIINSKNRQSVIKLLRRGLLYKGSDSLELMNESFRLFLVTNYSMHDKKEFKKSMGVGPSNWIGSKYAIILVIVALFVFIFISNQEFLQNMNKLFVMLAASIAGISSLKGLLGSKSKES